MNINCPFNLFHDINFVCLGNEGDHIQVPGPDQGERGKPHGGD